MSRDRGTNGPRAADHETGAERCGSGLEYRNCAPLHPDDRLKGSQAIPRQETPPTTTVSRTTCPSASLPA